MKWKGKAVTIAVTVTAMLTAMAQNAPAPASKPAAPPKAAGSAPAQPAAAKTLPLPKKVAIADDYDTWVKPLYPTAKGQEKTVTQVERYPYREYKYQPPAKIDPLPKGEYRYLTPEDTQVSRVSAMMNLDYDGWMASWDPKSQEFLKTMSEQPEYSKQKRLDQWRGVFSSAREQMVRKIQTGDYVIVTYELLNAKGQSVLPFEVPATFKEIKGLWYGTEDLGNDALVLFSPWTSGKLAEEVDIRPLKESVIVPQGPKQ